MQSSSKQKVWKVQTDSAYGGNYGVWANERVCAAGLMKIEHAERLTALLNDMTVAGYIDEHVYMLASDSVKIARVIKLFCLQENLTWKDLGFGERAIRDINRYLEMPLDLRQQASE